MLLLFLENHTSLRASILSKIHNVFPQFFKKIEILFLRKYLSFANIISLTKEY